MSRVGQKKVFLLPRAFVVYSEDKAQDKIPGREQVMFLPEVIIEGSPIELLTEDNLRKHDQNPGKEKENEI